MSEIRYTVTIRPDAVQGLEISLEHAGQVLISVKGTSPFAGRGFTVSRIERVPSGRFPARVVYPAGQEKLIMSEDAARARLEYLRGEIRAERISYGELAELQNLAPYIESGDTELLEPAGVPEYPQEEEN